ncbi:ABC transporter ATP-binding protein [Paenibacillus sp. OAS669]|uniref:ABC transporter ATP-binding protein n=1 Tax=Paenibacillus sp. OAS669 TaxID=2663821 RepID=UPI001789BAFC|nr:ABC transporter ATP-binding protein [Paenibacillus sp. OAS669]MBE1445771.1 ABC-type multidrug transport system ATPase subunit [Paenibacillus sp. OAS669]
MDKPVLRLNQVAKRIQKQQIIHSVDFTLSQGQALALCGGNGAGKSTILRMIAGILQPTSGSIEVNGVSWKQNRQGYAEQIGFMPDDYMFGQGLSAEETLSFWASLRKVPKNRVQEILSTVGLHEVRAKSVASFSKGMRQRLLFAQALLTKPSLLILDEPTNGLDPYWLESFISLVRAAKRDGHTVIFSTHQLEIAEVVADHAIFLKEGRIMEEGTVSAFHQTYGSHGLQGAFHRLFGLPSYIQPNGGEIVE